MPFQYKELTRRQLLSEIPDDMPQDISKAERMKLRSLSNNHAGNITEALNALGADSWELVSAVASEEYGGEVIYVFKKTI